MTKELSDGIFKTAGYQVHHWAPPERGDITVLHKEPFKLSWLATQLVTYVFLIHRPIKVFSQTQDDYAALRKFAGEHKRTFLPFSLQCGYALLPVYIGETFPEPLIGSIRLTYQKRWCVFHTPSLLDANTGRLVTLERTYLWGRIYRNYLLTTLHEVAQLVSAPESR